MFVVAMLLVLAAMVGFLALQQGHYGHLGWVGFYMLVVGILVQVLGLGLLLPGSTALLLLLPVTTLDVLVGGVPAAIALGTYSYVWLGLVWLALGYLLWRHRGTATKRSSRVQLGTARQGIKNTPPNLKAL